MAAGGSSPARAGGTLLTNPNFRYDLEATDRLLSYIRRTITVDIRLVCALADTVLHLDEIGQDDWREYLEDVPRDGVEGWLQKKGWLERRELPGEHNPLFYNPALLVEPPEDLSEDQKTAFEALDPAGMTGTEWKRAAGLHISVFTTTIRELLSKTQPRLVMLFGGNIYVRL